MKARFTAQLLAGRPAHSVVDAVRRLVAVQAQDRLGYRLAIRARTKGVTAADVDRALTDERSVVVTWLHRGTLHLVTAEDYWWLHALTTPPLFTGNARRLRQEGVSEDDADRGVDVVVRAVTRHGPQTRDQLRDRLASACVPVAGQALVHVLMRASLGGHVVRGPIVDGDHAYVLVRDWLGRPPPAVDRDVALGELGRRYLAGHGPATDRDLAKWSGLPLRDARGALGDAAASACDGEVPPPRLLGRYEPVLLGWASREWIVGRHTALVTVNGLFRPFALVRGRAVATWRLTQGEVVLEPFTALRRADRDALDADAEDVKRFLGFSSDRRRG